MRVRSVQFCLLSFLVFTYAHHGQQKHEEPKSKGVEHLVSPLGSGEHSFVDITPNVLATIESGASPVMVANSMRDQNTNSFPPDSKWPIPQNAINLQSYLHETANNSTKPTGTSQLSLTFPPNPALMDPQTFQPAAPPKPNNPLQVYQLLGNLQKPNTTFGAFFVSPSSTTTEADPETNSNPVINDPLPNPVPGLISASQSTFGNATNLAQGLTNQLGAGGLLAGFGNRPSNDEAASGSSAGGAANPIQSLIDSTQASWNNATGAAQNLAGQFGSNVQNGISNIFGINLNRPSNDESSSSTDSPDTTPSSEGTTTEDSSSTNNTDPVVPLVIFVNNTDLTSTGVTNQQGANLPYGFGFPALLFQKPTRDNIEQEEVRLLEPTVEEPSDDPPPPARASCPACPNTCTSSQRIIGGSYVNPTNKYPWVVLITYSNTPVGQGALINDRSVVTTATIVKSLINPTNARALIGVYNKLAISSAISKKISGKVIHPGYNSNNLYEDNIGILTLMGPLTAFTPVCLPLVMPEAPPVPKAIVIGWGATTPNGPESNVLKEAEMQMYPPLLCGLASPLATTKNLCGGAPAFGAGFVSTCKGDGGNPLVVKKASSYELVGIALDIPGARCGMPNPPSMFTNIMAYRSWINTNAPGCLCYMSG